MADLANAVVFATVAIGLLLAHTVGDHWVQTHRQALTKGDRNRAGQLACLRHVASYTVTTAAFTGLLWWLLDLPITQQGFITGQLVSAVTHYWADRRHTLAKLAALIGKGDFYRLGMPRPGHDDNPSTGTGAYHLDQSWHWLWIGVAALLTAVIE